MAVPAIELKPRGPVALFDSAIRLCARSSGVWALTLPGAAVVMWAALRLSDALGRFEPLFIPVAVFCAAWIVRGVCQAAACHYLDEQLLAQAPPDAWRSLRAALQRFPSVVITATYLPLFTAVSLIFTLGVGFFLLSAHITGWAAMMKGKGHPLALYGTCARMLGPARGSATPVRLLFFAILLFALNVHAGANLLIYLGRKLAGLELTYLQRFTSLDNGDWVLVVALLSFAAFEPLRAAASTLLLIDGRVRQEGVDLTAAVEQLPRRRPQKTSAVTSSAAALMAATIAALWAPSAFAQGQSQPPPMERIRQAAAACDYRGPLANSPPDVSQLSEADRAALERLADDVSLFTWTWEDCEATAQRLDSALPQLREAAKATADRGTPGAGERARQILARPEFAPAPTAPVPDATEDVPEEDNEDGLWARFRKWLGRILEDLFKPRPSSVATGGAMAGAGMGAAKMVTVLFLVAAVVLVAVLLFLAFRGRRSERAKLEVHAERAAEPSGANAESALSRPPEGWAHLADELAARGEFREAVRSLYLALLSKLHRVGAIDYDPALSNWDYCRQFRGHREWVPAFRDVTNRFDFAWYGKVDVGPDGYRSFRSLTEPILSAPVANDDAGGARA